jgi:general secretion pathway protein D
VVNVKNLFICVLAFCVWAAPVYANAQTPSTEGAPPAESALRSDAGVPLERLVAMIARKTGKIFVLDPRVHANVVLVGQDPAATTWPQFLTVLETYGFVAVEVTGFVRIVPDTMVRQQPIATITSKDTRAASEYVTQVIPLKYISAAQLVPVLRPMLPQQAHLAAVTSANALLIVDRFANVRRIEALVKSLDTPENKPRDVEAKKEPQ